LVVTTYTIHLPQDSSSSKSEQGLNIGPTHSPGRREAAKLSTEILDQFLEFITDPPPRVPPERPAPRVSATAKAKQKAIYRDPRIQDSHIICPDIATRVTRSRLQNTLFSNGLSKATAFLTLEASAVETTIHHGLAVTHYKTGKQMEYKDLICDPHYQDGWMISSAIPTKSSSSLKTKYPMDAP
jgi:hypothetical protein